MSGITITIVRIVSLVSLVSLVSSVINIPNFPTYCASLSLLFALPLQQSCLIV